MILVSCCKHPPLHQAPMSRPVVIGVVLSCWSVAATILMSGCKDDQPFG